MNQSVSTGVGRARNAVLYLPAIVLIALLTSACGGGAGNGGGGGGNGGGSNTPASITSMGHALFAVGVTGSFTVTANGSPSPSLLSAGPLPSGVSFADSGNGTATLSGKPASGSQGLYPITLTAHNGVGADAVQNFTLGVSLTANAPASFPLKIGASGRFLVDKNNAPFLIVGDAPQSLIGNLSESDATFYFANRQAAGFNAVWINLLCDSYTGCNSDGTTPDGIAPFTTPGDLSTPNSTYFQRADDMINIAAAYGLVVFLDPIETGGWLSTLESNGSTKAYNYGKFVGNRYKSFPNIIWLSGNDFQTWNTDATANADVVAVAQGIHDADANHLQTAELNFQLSASLEDPQLAPLLGVDGAYTYFPTYAEMLDEYDKPSFLPVFLVESNYEFEHNASDPGDPPTLRRQEYWTTLGGGSGQIYGNHYIWPFLSGWKSNLDTTGSAQLAIAKSLFAAREWYNLVPDQTQSFVTAGNGTFSSTDSISNNDYLTAGVTSDGTLAIAYMPSSRSITVNMAVFSAAVTVRWFDPTNGLLTPVAGSPLANSGSQVFTPPGNNNDGDGDWVLVFEVNPIGP